MTASYVEALDWGTRLLTALAGFWVAVERILNFGGRWNFHRQMVAEYCAVKDMIDLQKDLSEEERKVYRRQVMDRLGAFRQKGGNIPGVVLGSTQQHRN